MKRLLLVLLAWVSLPILTGTLSLRAADGSSSPGDRLLQQELKQQQIQAVTRRVEDQLQSIIAEFERNGLTGEDLRVLKAVSAVLGKLTTKDMEQVLSLLQTARGSGDVMDSKRNAAAAYTNQKVIITQLHQLILEYERQQALYELSLRLKALADRQSENMRLGVWLARLTQGRSFNTFDESQKLSLQLQESEQGTIKDEVALVLDRLEKLARESQGGPTAERPRAAAQKAQESGLRKTLAKAEEELKSGRLLSATGNEKRSRDLIREVARLLTLTKDPVEALRNALRELDRIIDHQEQLRTDTKSAANKELIDKAENQQADLVDVSDLLRKDLDELAPLASDQIKNATDQMQEARSVLASDENINKKRDGASRDQTEALNRLEQAKRALQEQLAKAEEQSLRPDNKLEELKDLQRQVEALAAQEESLKKEAAADEKAPDKLQAKAPQQGELQDKARELQEKAAFSSPPAASSMSEAADQMQQSQRSLAQARNNPDAQQAAIDALKNASRQLAQDVARLEQAQKDLDALEALDRKVAAIIKEQQDIQLETAKAAAQPKTPPVTETARQQGKLAEDTAGAQKDAEPIVPPAAPYLASAKGEMDTARSHLEATKPNDAQPKQTEALVDLHSAKQEIERKMDELRNELGLPMESGALADAASAIEKAQKDVNEAMSQMQNAPPGLMENLQQQQQQIAEGLKQLNENHPEASPTARHAEQAAQAAAEQLGQSDLRRAIESMKQAQSNMQAAGQENGEAKTAEAMAPLARKQADVRKMAEQLAAAMQAAPANAMKKAASFLSDANSQIGPLTAGQAGPLPPAAQSALQSAQGALVNATAQATANQSLPAQAHAANAAQALAQAQAALALAQAGLSGDAAMAASGQGNQPGQQGQGQGQGKGQGRTPNPRGNGRIGNWNGAGGADGGHRGTDGSGQFLGLPKRDRAAILQSQTEKYPQEYGTLVEQYLKNLSDDVDNENH